MVADNLLSTARSDTFLLAGTAPLSASLNEDHPSGDTVLKKAAIIVVGSAAVILAASPLALADSFDHSPQCKSARQAADNSVAQAASATTPVAALLGAAANVGVPVNLQTQAPILSCNNLEDLVDVNVRDNFQDNSKNIDKSKTVNRD
jgi:hypothetical protein